MQDSAIGAANGGGVVTCDGEGHGVAGVRNLTQDEWDRYGPDTRSYEATCHDWPVAS